jgi:hypothetical protein
MLVKNTNMGKGQSEAEQVKCTESLSCCWSPDPKLLLVA